MKIITAVRQLQKECEFLGITFTELISDLEKAPLSFPNRTIDAYKVYYAHRLHLMHILLPQKTTAPLDKCPVLRYNGYIN